MEREQSIEEKNIRALPNAMIDDFRGFIMDGEELPVEDSSLHALTALQELEKYPGWEYEHGVGRDVIAELLLLRKAIYITRIKIDENKYQRTIAYCKDAYSQEIEYKGTKQPLANVIKNIALGNGYDVDEYRVKDAENYKFNVTNFRAELMIKKKKSKAVHHKSFSEGDKPIFSSGKYIGFIHNGKFYSASNHKIQKKTGNEENSGSGDGR